MGNPIVKEAINKSDASICNTDKSAVVKTVDQSSSKCVRMIISDKNWLETNAVDQLKKTGSLEGMRYVVGMPDLHPGKGQPIGAAFVTQNTIYPHLVGSDIGCGMGLFKLGVNARKVKIDKWEKKLTDLDGPWIEGCVETWLSEAGLFTSDIDLKKVNSSLGTIGGGNHFAEIQKVEEVFDMNVMTEVGLDKNSVVLLVHSGSRGLGQSILRNHVDCFGTEPLLLGSAYSLEKEQAEADARRYLMRHNYAARWAVENRRLIAHRFCGRLSLDYKPILDVTHNMVLPLTGDQAKALGLESTGSYWIHRKGASPTDKGLVMIPGSRGSLSFLVRPKRESLDDLAVGGFSLAHGAGRKWKRSESRGRLQNGFHAKDLEVTDLGSRVICKQRDLLYEEAPQAYKNITTVIDDLVTARMIDVIASFAPVITYKTRKK